MKQQTSHRLPIAARCRSGRAYTIAALLLLLGSLEGAGAAGRAIEDIRFSRQDSRATAEFSFPCAVRYLSHSPGAASVNFQIRLALGDGCRQEIGTGVRSELFQPPGRELVGIHEVAFDTGAIDEATITVSFGHSVSAEISQGATRNVVKLVVAVEERRVTEAPSITTADSLATIPTLVSAPVSPAPTLGVTVPRRAPLRLVGPETQLYERFVVQLTTDAASASVLPPTDFEERILYSNDVSAGGRSWTELRLGFFDSEQAARAALDELLADFPEAVIAVAGVEEQNRAHANLLGDAREDTVVTPAVASEPIESEASVEPLPEERAIELMAEARNALLDQDYDRAIQIYTRILEDPAYSGRREASELLGVARERNGQLAHAKMEYQAYLTDFPDGPDAQRVRQRLAGLVTVADAPPAQALRAAPADEAQGWDFTGGVSQYYRHDVIQMRDDERSLVGQSGLNSRVDFVARRQGERFDLLGRVNAGYYYDMRDEDRRPEDQGLISNANLQITDRERDLSAIVGRQSLYKSGVLGRFDGAHVSYQWRPDIALNFTAGFPVDSPRYALSTDRNFFSMSADFDNVLESWDFSVFGHLQQIDGIADREAVGGEAHFRNDRWSLVGALDLDLSYEVLNSALVVANWRATDRITFNGRLNIRAAQFLTTRNALVGQPVETVEDLLRSFSEPAIRRLARDRTAQTQSVSIGLSSPVFQRFRFNGDLTYIETDATVASGGVDLVPASGPQYLYYASLVGSSLFKSGDTVIFGLRHTESEPALITALTFDVRLPIGQRLRLNPRIGLSLRESQRDNSQQWIASPMLRIIYRWGQRHRFEAELGGEWSNRDLPSLDPLIAETSEDSSSHFVNIGYWMEF